MERPFGRSETGQPSTGEGTHQQITILSISDVGLEPAARQHPVDRDNPERQDPMDRRF